MSHGACLRRTLPAARILVPTGALGQDILDLYPPPARYLPRNILYIINFVLAMAAVVALAFVVYGAFRYIAARGEESDLVAAKTAIAQALIGLTIIGLAAAIVNLVVGTFVPFLCVGPGC